MHEKIQLAVSAQVNDAGRFPVIQKGDFIKTSAWTPWKVRLPCPSRLLLLRYYSELINTGCKNLNPNHTELPTFIWNCHMQNIWTTQTPKECSDIGHWLIYSLDVIETQFLRQTIRTLNSKRWCHWYPPLQTKTVPCFSWENNKEDSTFHKCNLSPQIIKLLTLATDILRSWGGVTNSPKPWHTNLRNSQIARTTKSTVTLWQPQQYLDVMR